MIKIFISENIPSLNKGEMAILDGMIESFKTLGDVEISMLSPRPELDEPRYASKIRVINISRFWPFNGGLNSGKSGKILVSIFVMLQHIAFILSYNIIGDDVLKLFRTDVWEEYLKSDIIIMGHNGTFGIGGSLGTPLLYPIYLPIIARILQKPVVLYAGSVPRPHQFQSIISRLYKFALNNIDLITLRERESFRNLTSVGAKEINVAVTADLAFLMKPAQLKRINEIMISEGIDNSPTLLVGMTITREIASKSKPEFGPDASYYSHITMISEFIDNISSNYKITFIFIPHCIGFGRYLDDRLAAQDIFDTCTNKENVKLITDEYDAQELKGLIGVFDLFIGERVHSVINAMSMIVPSICISFSNDKRLDILRMIGQENAICSVENLHADDLIRKFNEIWSNKESIKDDLSKRIKEFQDISRSNGELLKKYCKKI